MRRALLAAPVLVSAASCFGHCKEPGSPEFFGNKSGWPAPQDVSDTADRYRQLIRALAQAAAAQCAPAVSPPATSQPAERSAATQPTLPTLPSPARGTALEADRTVLQVTAECQRRPRGDERPLATDGGDEEGAWPLLRRFQDLRPRLLGDDFVGEGMYTVEGGAEPGGAGERVHWSAGRVRIQVERPAPPDRLASVKVILLRGR